MKLYDEVKQELNSLESQRTENFNRELEEKINLKKIELKYVGNTIFDDGEKKQYNEIYCGDCLELMKNIPNNSVDMILCDLPYGTSACSWDSVIDLKELWKQYIRIIKDTGAIVLCSQQPFTALLICSNLEMYKYNWVWEKDNGTNFLNSHYQPLKVTEDICVFGKLGCSFNKKGNMIYIPQFEQGKPYTCVSGNQKSNSAVVRGGTGGREDVSGFKTYSDGKRYPKNLIRFNRDKDKLHPTQKPIALFEYLIKTYSNEGDLILDNCAGSGTTGVACINTKRNYILMEKDDKYFEIAKKRLDEVKVSIPPKDKSSGILDTFL